MAFVGKYELVKTEGFLEHLIASGVPEEIAKKNSQQTNIEIALNGDKLGFQRDDGQFTDFGLNQEVESKTPDGQTVKTKSELNGNVLTVAMTTDKGTRKVEMTLSGSELTLSLLLLDLSHCLEILDGMIVHQNKAQHAELARELHIYATLKTSRDKFRSISVLISQVSSHSNAGVPVAKRIFKKL